MTTPLFRDDAYLRTCEAEVLGVNERGGIVLDRTVFYATGGGQPGDSGALELEDGSRFEIATTVYDGDKTTIVHVPAEDQSLPAPGTRLTAHIDWARRYRLMRMHTALHLLSVALPYPVTGGQIGDPEGRLDFNMGEESIDKDALHAQLNALAAGDHEVTSDWISDEELDANPGLVKTMSVKPPRGSGRVRLVRIGGEVDLQPCGGTHVTRTLEIGALALGKIENKGKQNRRVRIRLTD